MHITILCGLATETFSLVALCEKLIGGVGSHIINFIIFFHTAGTAVSYYLLLGDTLPGLLELAFPNVAYFDRKNVILAFGLLCTFPLSLSRSTSKFVKWSVISVVLLMFMLLGVLIRVPYYIPAHQDIELEVVPVSENMFKGLAIISLSFGCAQNLFGVYTTTRNQKPSNWLLICSIAIGIAFTVNIVFAVMAYMCFGKNVQANILLNFPENDPGIRLVKLALGLFMVLTIPLCMHPCREAVMLMFGININNPTKKQHYTATVGVFLVVLYFGATLTSLGKVFDVIGGFSTTVLGFMLPGFAYIYLFSGDLFSAHNTNKYASWKLFFISIICIVIAIPVMFFSVKDALFQ
ncbi:transmembrane amino acid transporter protein-domain-containing protein [Parasitella parasitica]|nr:transmembrane amino acid transporter protein-domain-containing protein [Parasitella parasitica]